MECNAISQPDNLFISLVLFGLDVSLVSDICVLQLRLTLSSIRARSLSTHSLNSALFSPPILLKRVSHSSTQCMNAREFDMKYEIELKCRSLSPQRPAPARWSCETKVGQKYTHIYISTEITTTTLRLKQVDAMSVKLHAQSVFFSTLINK